MRLNNIINHTVMQNVYQADEVLQLDEAGTDYRNFLRPKFIDDRSWCYKLNSDIVLLMKCLLDQRFV